MNTSFQVFKTSTGSKLRTLLKDGGYFFAGKDAAKSLGYTNSRKAIRDHVDPEDQLEERIVTPKGARSLVFISEPGLYSLILSSKLPEAKAFKRWVTAEVLPALRSTGSYSVAPTPTAISSYNWAEKNGYYYIYTVDSAHKLTWRAKFVYATEAAQYCELMNASHNTPNSLTV